MGMISFTRAAQRRKEQEAREADVESPPVVSPSAPLPLACPECGKVCGSPLGLGAHMRKHKDKPE